MIQISILKNIYCTRLFNFVISLFFYNEETQDLFSYSGPIF